MTVRPESDSAPANGFQCDVLIPCYNYGRYLADCVRSALRQGGGMRILIIDDASTDETSEIGPDLARRHPEVEYVRHRTNIGHIRTYNEGIDWATSPYFTLLSADDLMMPGAVARAESVFLNHPDVLMVYGRELQFLDGVPVGSLLDGSASARMINGTSAIAGTDNKGTPVAALDVSTEMEPRIQEMAEFYRLIRAGGHVHACATFTRTNAQKRLGGYLEALPHAGDLEMWLRFAAYGPLAWVPRFQVARRQHSSNMWKRYDAEADIRQRALVFEATAATLVAVHGGQQDGLAKSMWSALAVDAVKAAGARLADGDCAGAERLIGLACEFDPTVVRHPRWVLHQLKRAAGGSAIQGLRPLKSLAARVLGSGVRKW